MAQKKETGKDVKIQDLAPKKDAKGGRASLSSSANAAQSLKNQGLNAASSSSNAASSSSNSSSSLD